MKKHIGTFIAIIALAYTGYVHYNSTTEAPMGIVQQDRLMSDFEGMKAAMLVYSEQVEQWDRSIDSMTTSMQLEIQSYQQVAASLSEEQQMREVTRLKQLQANVERYKVSIQEKASAQDQQMSLGVFNQLASLVEQYAKANGFKVIIANTASQNVAYSESATDITDQVLAWVNTEYENRN
jgi:Skp family chaperone for outer membrane proteins